ncbi:hypothetical protein HMPREF3213_02091 [Heyndrickxia coagulans]|uniref:DUF1805 domain-containing protein n=2 Tax=Bacillaceae TaxID=186817 RepID=A0A133KNT5_HEYCO|nr:hypothetical protein HMPREF3213_02091 [Heyndrickxia coagulans]
MNQWQFPGFLEAATVNGVSKDRIWDVIWQHIGWQALFTALFIKYERKGRMEMVTVTPVEIGGHTFIATTVRLPKTTLLAVSCDKGYIMCGALDVGLLNDQLKDRHIIAGRAVGVKTIEQLLEAPLELVTHEAEKIGVTAGMIGKQALLKMI